MDKSSTISWYLRTNKLLINVAGTQNIITSTSANAKLAMNKFVTVLIRGTRKTTEMTKRLPMSPTLNTSVYAMQYMIDIVDECRISCKYAMLSLKFSFGMSESSWICEKKWEMWKSILFLIVSSTLSLAKTCKICFQI